jgi:hypothetical protein
VELPRCVTGYDDIEEQGGRAQFVGAKSFESHHRKKRRPAGLASGGIQKCDDADYPSGDEHVMHNRLVPELAHRSNSFT